MVSRVSNSDRHESREQIKKFIEERHRDMSSRSPKRSSSVLPSFLDRINSCDTSVKAAIHEEILRFFEAANRKGIPESRLVELAEVWTDCAEAALGADAENEQLQLTLLMGITSILTCREWRSTEACRKLKELFNRRGGWLEDREIPEEKKRDPDYVLSTILKGILNSRDDIPEDLRKKAELVAEHGLEEGMRLYAHRVPDDEIPAAVVPALFNRKWREDRRPKGLTH